MSKEVRIGILALVVFVVLIWGYNFLKGQNLFDNNRKFYVKYENVEQLEVASQVLVHGYKVGAVTKIQMDPNDYSKVLVEIDVKGEIKVPKNTQATIISLGLVGGKAIVLDIDRECQGDDCAQSGDSLPGGMRGMLSAMVPVGELDTYMEKIKSGFKGAVDSLSSGDNDMGNDIKQIISNFNTITEKFDLLLSNTNENIEGSMANIEALTRSLKASDGKINSIIDNLNEVSISLKNANIDSLIIKGDDAVAGLTKSISSLESILKKADASLKSFDGIMSDVEKGKGTLGKLIKDDKLYNDLDLTIKHTNLLLQDLRLYPGRYLNISLLKGKGKKYKKVESDPGLED
jgi:phospholipid/cholesterol/gamma-HCH transport system substrate-binding protein